MNSNKIFNFALKNNNLYLILLIIVSFIVSLLDLQNPIHHYYEFFDATLYQYIGKMVWHNQLPYKDIFDHKGPITYFWNALGYIIHPMHGRWFIEFIALLTSTYISFSIAKIFISPLLSFLITCVLFFNTPFYDTIGNTESFATFLLFICLKIYINYLQDNTLSKSKNLSLGLLCALLLLAKPTYLIMPAVFILITTIELLYQKKYTILKTSIYYFCIGFFTILSIFLGIYLYNNALTSLWENYIIFNIDYVKYWQSLNSKSLVLNIFLSNKIIKCSLYSIAILLLFYKKYSPKEHKLILFASTSFILSLISIIIPNNPFNHYMYPLFPISFILFVLVLKIVNNYKYIISFLLLISLCFDSYHIATYLSSKKENKNVIKVAKIIDYYLKDGETFQTIGWDMGRLHLLSNHNCSTQYPMPSMLDRIYPETIYSSIKKASPPIIVILPDNPPYHVELINYFWPNFWNEYILIYKEKTDNYNAEIYLKAKSKLP